MYPVNPVPRAKASGFEESTFGDSPSSPPRSNRLERGPHSSAWFPWYGVNVPWFLGLFLLFWGALGIGAFVSVSHSVPLASFMVVPVCGAGLWAGAGVAWVLAVLSLGVWALLIFSGTSASILVGPGFALLVLAGMLWVADRQFRSRWQQGDRQQEAFQASLKALRQEQKSQQERLHVQEEEISKISELYGLSKQFLATLNLEDALSMTEEALTRWMPQLTPSQCTDYLNQVRALIHQGKVSREALIQTMPLSESDWASRERWEIVCGQLALGLQRVALYRQVQELAIHDGLTGLLTRRYFRDRLEEELSRTTRRGTSLAFLMVDLDHFKNINDTYGHLVGDVVLREVAGFIRRSVREVDLVGRFGGEEFGIVLPDADQALGIQIADRIRQAIEAASIQAYEETVQITVSIGISLCPFHATQTDLLIEQADQAMYAAKRMGRNQTIFYQGERARAEGAA